MITTLGRGLLALFLTASTLPAATLTATLPDGTEIGRIALADGAEWCVLWNHSVQGFPVQDCYQNRAGRMVLVRSHQPDFAAGLGHLPGRGRQTSDGQGGYWIEDIDEPVPGDAYVLRPGRAAVNHRIVAGDAVIPLSVRAARQRVRIALQPGDPE
ncbi:DUF1850 domain-containing protein [Marinovum sp.]|uniref:DUF1850 domain-containing protein n=1 Tax=Marinovum sp. TaxID=2024839 RepID=UPI003A955F52